MLVWAGRIYDFLRVLEGIVGYYRLGCKVTCRYNSGWDRSRGQRTTPQRRPRKRRASPAALIGERGALRLRVGPVRDRYDDVTGFVQGGSRKGPRSAWPRAWKGGGKSPRAPRRGVRRWLDEPLPRNQDGIPGDGSASERATNRCVFRIRRVSRDKTKRSPLGRQPFLGDRCPPTDSDLPEVEGRSAGLRWSGRRFFGARRRVMRRPQSRRS